MNTKKHKEHGFSLIELLMVIGAVMILMAMAVMLTQNVVPAFRANTAMNQVVHMMRSARHNAISDRRITTVSFIGNNQIQLLQTPPPPPVGAAPVPLGMPTSLEGGAQFVILPGETDTPMKFGNGATAPIYFYNPTTNTAAPPSQYQFFSDGSFGAAIGAPLNGTVFIGIPGNSTTARAVTILGATGRIRSYHWNGTAWQE